jgi:hypothetical protein
MNMPGGYVTRRILLVAKLKWKRTITPMESLRLKAAQMFETRNCSLILLSFREPSLSSFGTCRTSMYHARLMHWWFRQGRLQAERAFEVGLRGGLVLFFVLDVK